jgi:hypothetical protein
MQEPWEVFWSACVQAGILEARAEQRPASRLSMRASAIGRAAEVTIKYLRNQRDWTWVNARLLAGRLVDTATDWALDGGRSADELRMRLRETWQEERTVAHQEAEWRALTQTVLDGARAGVTRDDAAA